MDKNSIKVPLKGYGLISIGLGLFVLVYEQFSHGIYSNLMRFSVFLPIISGVVIYVLYKLFRNDNKAILSIWNMGMTTFIFGFLLYGVYEIYGIEEPLVFVFFYAGGLLCLVTLFMFFYSLFIRKITDCTNKR